MNCYFSGVALLEKKNDGNFPFSFPCNLGNILFIPLANPASLILLEEKEKAENKKD